MIPDDSVSKRDEDDDNVTDVCCLGGSGQLFLGATLGLLGFSLQES
jgi:hypothetical protein